jgi:hypothetical protein
VTDTNADRIVMTAAEIYRAAERARVLARIVETDPTDVEAKVSLALLRQQGLALDDPEWVLGFRPDELPAPDAPHPIAAPAPNADERDPWIAAMLGEANGYANVGLLDRAIDLLEAVLRMSPSHDVARARLFALEVRRLGGEGRSADDTLRIPPR